jgi:hypothetical protein
MSLVIVYLASPRAAGWLEWHRLECLFASLVLLKHMRPLPVIVFHEDYTEDDKRMLATAVKDITFEQVDFTGHESAYVDRRPGERVGTYGYVMMCRFFSGIMQRHPLLSPYSHYMRLDDDSYIIGRVEDEAVDRLMSYDYSYSSTFSDPYRDLWDFSLEFMAREGLTPACEYQDGVPYTNFHVSSLKLWRHPVIEKYVDALEAEQGCVKHRWDDAQTHAIIALAMAPALGLTVNLEKKFPYRHNQQCCHKGPHTPYCVDGRIPPPIFHWGPPPQVVKGTRLE